jgi:hypothetical protein
MQRLDHIGIDPDPLEGGMQGASLDSAVGIGVEVLQRTAAAPAEMPASRHGTAGARSELLDDAALASRRAPRAEPSAHVIARNRKGQKDRLPGVSGNAVALRAEPLHQKLDDSITFELSTSSAFSSSAVKVTNSPRAYSYP